MKRLIALAMACLALFAAAAQAAPSYGGRADVDRFIAMMVETHGFKKRQLQAVFRKVEPQPGVIKAMTLAPESSQSWQTYRALFVNAKRIDAGVQFWNRYAGTLERAAAEFGVPEEVIVGIIGVETTYGRNMGTYRVIDALTTLAFDSPTRNEFFRGQLESYLLFTRDAKIDVFRVKGSYAGAIGIPQFMPGSYRRFALDYDGDGRADLAESPVDAIGSIGNFLRAHGWVPGQPVAVPARASGESWRSLVQSGSRARFRARELAWFGITPAVALDEESPCSLIELGTQGQPSELWVGLRNFDVLTQYNKASFYAIAVLELGRSMREIVKGAPPAQAQAKPAEAQ